MKITVGFSTKKTALAWLIRKAEKTPYSHCYIRYFNHFVGTEYVLHAAGSSVHLTEYSQFIDDKNIVIEEFDIALPDIATLKKIIKFSLSQNGKPYGALQLIGMAWARFLKGLAGKSFQNPFHDGTKTMVCSEFVAYILNILGFEIDMKHAEIDGPAWIHKQLVSNEKQNVE